MTDGTYPTGAHFARVYSEFIQLPLSHEIVGAGNCHAPFGIKVSKQHVDGHPSQHIVKTIGVLSWSSMNIHRRSFSMTG